MSQILLIDDEPAITESLAYALRRAGFNAEAASSLAEADAALAQGAPDLIILDLLLPDGHGLDWLRQLRVEHSTPVIILSSHDEEVDHIVGLEVGADDYVDKPFSPREVVARVRAILRRVEGRAAISEPSAAPPLRIDEIKREAWACGQRLSLSKIEFDLLHVFVRAPGRVFPRTQLLDKVWGPDVAIIERTVDVHVKSLRKKLVMAGLSAETIETVRGVGYRLREALD
ncbi:response regulator [Myxococcota bacterium]|nr:response regulator [Myxococcota bacterium]MBU1899576.1 response regulator [Myxococcota bacterium]